MKIRFNADAKLAGIGLVPWARLGPDRWFSRYKIAALYDWDMQELPGVPDVFAVAGVGAIAPRLARMSTKYLLELPEFAEMLKQQFSGYEVMTYKPIQPPQSLVDAGVRFLHVNQALATRIENKAAFRTLFHEELPFPAYKIIASQAVGTSTTAFTSVMANREAVVIQDEALSGGRGTRVIRTQDELMAALVDFKQLGGGTNLVVSDFIPQAYERSVQAVVTQHGVFVGPLQKQLVAHPLLANLTTPQGDKFCGGEVSQDDVCDAAYSEIRKYALHIGSRLQEMGYRGIFGVDYLVTDTGRVYVLEVNARVTGMTPLLTMLYRDGHDIPFILLHLLELAGMDYEILDDSIDTQPSEGGLLVLHSRENTAMTVMNSPASGLHDFNGRFKAKAIYFSAGAAEPELLVQRYMPLQAVVRPGERLLTAFTSRHPLMDQHDKLTPETEVLIRRMLANTRLQKV